jgi:F0F1-type ATP synthase assembly protein I
VSELANLTAIKARANNRAQICCIILILLCLAGALVFEAKHAGLAGDEPSHFAAGYLYWLGEDVLVPADTPPLTRMISGWVARVRRAPDPRLSKIWASRDAYLIGAEILGVKGGPGRRMLFYSRLPFLVFPLGIVFLLWHWGRQLFSGGTALILASCAALEPTILGLGPLINSDVPAAFAALWFAYAAWAYWRNPTARRLLFLTLTVVIAVLTKYTLMPLIPIAWALSLLRGPRLLAAALIPSAVYGGILAASQFQAHPLSATVVGEFPGAGVPRILLPLAGKLSLLPWPTQFIEGILYVGSGLHGDGFTGYMLGHKIHGWVPGYFPLAWAIKFPIPLQLFALAGLATFAVHAVRQQTKAGEVLIWSTAMLFLGLAVSSNFHIGFRHVVTSLPFLILGGGFALEQWRTSSAGRAAIGLAVVWLCISSGHVYPNGLSYFNEWIGGPKNGWKYLADSNVDWGQNYPELGAYLQRNKIQGARCFLFGFDNPWHYMREGTLSPQPWPSTETPPGRQYQASTGTYAISVNVLTGLVLPPGYEDYLMDFRHRTPVARAGYSIFIYKLN